MTKKKDDLDKWLDALVKRQDFLYKNVPQCTECKSNQIQILSHNKPAKWRCRDCKHRFEYEPNETKNKTYKKKVPDSTLHSTK